MTGNLGNKTKGNQIWVFDLTIPFKCDWQPSKLIKYTLKNYIDSKNTLLLTLSKEEAENIIEETEKHRLSLIELLQQVETPYFNKYIEFFKKIAKKWVFQLELGDETNYIHWQVRLSLIKKKFVQQFINLALFDPQYKIIEKAEIRPTNENSKNDFDYVSKIDSRIDGPWDYKTPIIDEFFIPKFVYTNEMLTYNSQKFILDLESQEPDYTTITYYLNYNGGAGKNTLIEYLNCYRKCCRLPITDNIDKLIAVVYCSPDAKTYLINIPKAIKQSKLYDFYSGIETIKDAWVYDFRYSWKSRYLEQKPHVFLFGNTLPPLNVFTKHKWAIYEIFDTNEIKKLDINELLKEDIIGNISKRGFKGDSLTTICNTNISPIHSPNIIFKSPATLATNKKSPDKIDKTKNNISGQSLAIIGKSDIKPGNTTILPDITLEEDLPYISIIRNRRLI